jgi:hypothetical protein
MIIKQAAKHGRVDGLYQTAFNGFGTGKPRKTCGADPALFIGRGRHGFCCGMENPETFEKKP